MNGAPVHSRQAAGWVRLSAQSTSTPQLVPVLRAASGKSVQLRASDVNCSSEQQCLALYSRLPTPGRDHSCVGAIYVWFRSQCSLVWHQIKTFGIYTSPSIPVSSNGGSTPSHPACFVYLAPYRGTCLVYISNIMAWYLSGRPSWWYTYLTSWCGTCLRDLSGEISNIMVWYLSERLIR